MQGSFCRAGVLALALGVLAGAGCNKADKQGAAPPDSTALLLGQDTGTAALSDTAPAATLSPATTPVPAPAPATTPRPAAKAPPASRPAPRPAAPAAPASVTAAAGTRVALAVQDSISSRTARAGQEFTATVQKDVTDASGRVVIPKGSTVTGTVAEVKPGKPGSEGTLTLAIRNVTVRGTTYPVDATIESATTVRQGRGVTRDEAVKVGAGAAVGAIAGRIIGKNTRGTIIGGVVGAAAGAGVAAATRDVDIVLPAGGAVEIVLSKPVTVSAR